MNGPSRARTVGHASNREMPVSVAIKLQFPKPATGIQFFAVAKEPLFVGKQFDRHYFPPLFTLEIVPENLPLTYSTLIAFACNWKKLKGMGSRAQGSCANSNGNPAGTTGAAIDGNAGATASATAEDRNLRRFICAAVLASVPGKRANLARSR